MRAACFAAVLIVTACVSRQQRPPEPTVPERFTVAATQARVAAARGMHQHADDVLRGFIEAHPDTPEAREAQYWRAIFRLEAASSKADRDEALRHLDGYLADTAVVMHGAEARIIRTLLRSADSLQIVRDSMSGSARQAAASREEELKKEVQTLKEQLDKTNEELNRIRRRLGGARPER